MHSCTRCAALVASRNRVVPGAGNPRARVVFVGEGPGVTEDQQGVPFVGPAGELLTEGLHGIGLRREDIYLTNVIKCHPPGNRNPDATEIAHCRDHLFAQLMLIAPAVVCILGRFALETLIDPKLRISTAHGKVYRKDGLTCFAMYHPAAALHKPELKADFLADFALLQAVLEQAGAG